MPPIVLVIAGSDSSAGAGIQADLRTLSALGVYAATAITAITVQNTTGVISIFPLPVELVEQQIKAVVEDLPVVAVKTGMLPGADYVRAVADAVRHWKLPNLVVDPVMVAKGGATLMGEDGARMMATELFPLATIVTPNLPEAEALLGWEIGQAGSYRRACRELLSLGPKYVVLKGGHRPGAPVDLLYDGEETWEFAGQRYETLHTHGTGCTFASALTGYIALRYNVPDAVSRAKAFVARSIHHSLAIGHGHGPVWQLGPEHRRSRE